MAHRGPPAAPSDASNNSSLQRKIQQLEVLFPYQSTAEIRYVLEMFRENLDDAVDVLSGSPGPSSSHSAGTIASSSRTIPKHNIAEVKSEGGDYNTLEDIPNHKTREKVANLLALGISCPIAFIVDILGNCNWNVDEAAILFLNGLIPTDIEEKPMTEGTGQVLRDRASTTSTSFDPTPPLTPSSPPSSLKERFRGGIIPGFVYSSKSKSASAQSQTQQPRSPPLENERSEQNEVLKSASHTISAPCDDVDMDLGVEESLDLMEISSPARTLSGASLSIGGKELKQGANSTYGFDSDPVMGQDEINQKVAYLREMLPVSERRCKAVLQICSDQNEAFELLYDEIMEHGQEMSSDESEEDEEDFESSESETERSVQGRGEPRGSISPESSRRQQKRRAETPEQEPPAKKSRVLVEEELDEEAEAAKLEPAGEWVLNTFGESDGIPVTLASGEHPCKFPKGLLSRYFAAFREQLDSSSSKVASDVREQSTTIDLPNVDRGFFELLVQLAITKSVQLEESQSKTRTTKITALLELVILATRLGLLGAGHIVAARLQEILIDKRNALHGRHIETAYTLRKGHPIRTIIVQSLGRAYFLSKQSPPSKRAQVYGRGEGDNARRSAFGGDRFIFQDQIDTIDDFAQELSAQKTEMFDGRTEIKTQKTGKIRKITFTDPLTEEEFSL